MSTSIYSLPNGNEDDEETKIWYLLDLGIGMVMNFLL